MIIEVLKTILVVGVPLLVICVVVVYLVSRAEDKRRGDQQ